MVTSMKLCGNTLNFWSKEELDILRLYYKGEKNNTRFITELIYDRFKIKRTFAAVRHKAAALGLTRVGFKHEWKPEDIEKLHELAGTMNVERISCKIGLSASSIKSKAHRLGINLHSTNRFDWYTLDDVHQIFGVWTETIKKWMKEGSLKYSKYNDSTYQFKRTDLRNFILTYPFELTARNLDLIQYNSILCPNHATKYHEADKPLVQE